MKCKVLTLGRAAREVEVADGATVADAITAAGAPKDSAYTRHLNGSPCFDSDVIVEGCVITLVPQVKGGC
jgi:sulfur carrier protein ThiS